MSDYAMSDRQEAFIFGLGERLAARLAYRPSVLTGLSVGTTRRATKKEAHEAINWLLELVSEAEAGNGKIIIAPALAMVPRASEGSDVEKVRDLL